MRVPWIVLMAYLLPATIRKWMTKTKTEDMTIISQIAMAQRRQLIGEIMVGRVSTITVTIFINVPEQHQYYCSRQWPLPDKHRATATYG